MVFIVDKCEEDLEKPDDYNFFINVTGRPFPWLDCQIAEVLDLTIDEYQNILKKYGGELSESDEMMFKTFKDCERALNSEELFSRIIMFKLMGE